MWSVWGNGLLAAPRAQRGPGREARPKARCDQASPLDALGRGWAARERWRRPLPTRGRKQGASSSARSPDPPPVPTPIRPRSLPALGAVLAVLALALPGQAVAAEMSAVKHVEVVDLSSARLFELSVPFDHAVEIRERRRLRRPARDQAADAGRLGATGQDRAAEERPDPGPPHSPGHRPRLPQHRPRLHVPAAGSDRGPDPALPQLRGDSGGRVGWAGQPSSPRIA